VTSGSGGTTNTSSPDPKQPLLSRFHCPVVMAAEAFTDGKALMRVAEKQRAGRRGEQPASAPYSRVTPGLAQAHGRLARG
jgi:hypothetical protein